MRTLLAVAIVCSVSLGNADAPAPKPISSIPIGAYLSMTGIDASFGISTNEGIQLAIDEHNARTTGRKLRVDVLDTKSKTGDVATTVTRLADQGVVALLGEVSSAATIAGGRIAQQRGIPMITPAATNAAVTQLGNMISRVAVLDGAQGRAMAKFAREQLKATKIATLVDETPYSTTLAEHFTRAFIASGGKIGSAQTYKSNATDFKLQLKAIAAAGVQAIYVPGYYPDVAPLIKQARSLGMTIPVLGGDGLESDELATLTKATIDNVYYTTHFSTGDPRPATKAFVAAFTAKYKHPPDSLAALGYDAAHLLAAAIARARSQNGADIAAAIRATKNHEGATGTITIDPKTGDASKSVVIVKMTNQQPTFAATITPR